LKTKTVIHRRSNKFYKNSHNRNNLRRKYYITDRKWRRGRVKTFRRSRRNNSGDKRYYRNRNNDIKSTGLYVSNLLKDVTNNDLREIFSKCGNLKRCGKNWDRMGYSLGTAIVQFEDTADAKQATKEYNSKILTLDVEIDEKTIKVESARLSSRIKRLTMRKRKMNY
jgi:RNA recognition motif-containing protein